MNIAGLKSAMVIIAGALAAATTPAEPITPSQWAAKNLIVQDGPRKFETFDLSLTPYLREPLDFFADACPDNKASIKKSKQTGFTTLAIAATGYTIAVEPCDLFLIEPTDSSLSEFVSLKLQPTIDGSPALQQKVAGQVARSGKGSTTFVKKFTGGSLLLGIATSTADLRGKTRQKVIKDEASEYDKDLGGQGSPHTMIAGSYETFLRAGTWKELNISTPVIKGACYIDDDFEAGDKRFWFVKCPGCERALNFDFDLKCFKFNDTFPHETHYVAPCCGAVVEDYQRQALNESAEADGFGWIATSPGPGRHRSYHFDTLSSPFVPWDEIAKRYAAAKGDEAKMKTFDNLTLGQAHEVKGDAPDHVKLLERREDYEMGIVPAEALLLAGAADVQHNGIWYEIVGWAEDKQSWSIQHGFIEGDTTDPDKGAFAELDKIYELQLPDAFGGMRVLDAFAVDAGDGGRANQVYAWCRKRHRAFAIKGQPGWTTPAIGTPARVSITLKGKKLAGGAMVWPVGTYALKATFYDNLRKEGRKAGAESDPAGYCHYHAGCDERFFKQQTAESLVTKKVGGRQARVWQENGPNHLLDCRVYNMAMADMLGLTRMTGEQWAKLRQERGVPIILQQPDLLAADSVKLSAVTAHAPLLRQKRRGRRVVSGGVV